jgi:hypothetical protein
MAISLPGGLHHCCWCPQVPVAICDPISSWVYSPLRSLVDETAPLRPTSSTTCSSITSSLCRPPATESSILLLRHIWRSFLRHLYCQDIQYRGTYRLLLLRKASNHLRRLVLGYIHTCNLFWERYRNNYFMDIELISKFQSLSQMLLYR